jgi:hypothetical protein
MLGKLHCQEKIINTLFKTKETWEVKILLGRSISSSDKFNLKLELGTP